MKVLARQWNGETSRTSLSYDLIRQEGRITFRVRFPQGVTTHPVAQSGEYTSGLWRYDVGEFFITVDGQQYIEVNLAANGAWWMAGFTGIRQEDDQFIPPVVEVVLERGVVQWSCDEHSIAEYLGPIEKLYYNVAGILNTPDYEYLSLCDLGTSEPDFHQPRQFSKRLEQN